MHVGKIDSERGQPGLTQAMLRFYQERRANFDNEAPPSRAHAGTLSLAAWTSFQALRSMSVTP